MIDLQERFDRAWADEPTPVAVEQRLAVAHRTLRRRRLTVAAGALAAVVALGAGTAVAADLFPEPGGTQVAAAGPTPVDPGEPSGAQGVEVAQTAADLERIGPDHNAAYADDGRVVIRPGWVVTQKFDDVYLGLDMMKAVGLEITSEATLEREWYYLHWGTDGNSSVNRSWPQANLGLTLREWLPDLMGNRVRPEDVR